VSVVEYPVADWRQVIDVNLNGAFLCNRAVVPFMLKNDYGRIVNIASVASKEGNSNASVYSPSKAGMIALTKSLGKELARSGIRVNAVTPAAARTPIFDQMKQEHIDYMFSKIPIGRITAPRLLLVYAFGALICSLVVVANLPVISAVALIGVLAFESIMFPTIFGLAVRDLGAQTGRGASFMVMMIGGGLILPYPMGLLAQAYGTPVAYLLPAACFVLVGAYAGWEHRLKDAS
jgi:hypothetical protein